MLSASALFNLNTFKEYDIFIRNGYTITEKNANDLIESGKVQSLCDKYDLIMICVTIPMGTSLFKSKLTNKCKAKLALQIVTRYNFAITDNNFYDQLIRNLSNNSNVFWLPNNQYELYHMKQSNIIPPKERTFLTRPYGISFLNSSVIVEKKKTIIFTHLKEKCPCYKVFYMW